MMGMLDISYIFIFDGGGEIEKESRMSPIQEDFAGGHLSSSISCKLQLMIWRYVISF
jgi:hypothetical protein